MILQAMKDALETMEILSGYVLNERCGCGYAHTAESQRKLDKLEPIERKLNRGMYHLRAAINEMEKAEPVVWSLWQPFGGHIQFIGDQKLATQYGLRADVMVTPLYAHPAPAIPEGWQLVPKEPNAVMVDAGDAEIDPGYCEESSSTRFVEDGESMAIYKVMLAAAPEYKP